MGRYYCPICGGALGVKETAWYSDPMRICKRCGAEFALDGNQLHYLPNEDEINDDLKGVCNGCEYRFNYPDCKIYCDKC